MMQKFIHTLYSDNPALESLLTAHSRAVADKAEAIVRAHADDSCRGLDPETVRNAAMLHDIGVRLCDAPSIHCHGSEPYIRHGALGADMLRGLPEGTLARFGITGDPEIYARVCERHTGAGLSEEEIAGAGLPLPPGRTYLPETTLEKLICYADKFFSKSRTPDEEKPVEKIIAQMAAHGPGQKKRFEEMHSLFG